MRDYFEYPLDSRLLLRKKKVIEKKFLEANYCWLEKKIAVLGGSTTNEVVDQLNLFLLNYGIKASFYQSEYGKYWEDAVFGSAQLDSFKPDIIYIHTNWRNIETFPEIWHSEDEVTGLLTAEMNRYETMWQRLEEKFHCPIIQNNFDRPNYRLLGNRDIWDYRGRSNYISKMNQRFYAYAQSHNHFYINDLEFLSQDYGLSEWGNGLYWHMYKYGMCLDAIPYVAQSVANIIKSIYGKNKKALVLDLDNTLWGGIIGDDGVEGIQMGPESPKGEIYREFQEYCKKLKDIGVVLAINSKNELNNALAGLGHPGGVLRPKDFVEIKANWNPKDQNLMEIAEGLNLGVDSFVFADDSPAEREIVASQLPGVAVPVMEGVENYIRILDQSGYFEVTSLSAEDLQKTQQYQAKAEALKSVSAFATYEEYLNSLHMKATIDEFKPLFLQRIAQLTNKSNQFNLTTLRCSREDIERMQQDENYLCFAGHLTDKFGDNGLVSVVIGEIIEGELHLRLWLMSCRVLKRGMEEAMMNVVVSEARKKGISRLIGYYYPTDKNAMVQKFYESMGFGKIKEDSKGNTEWELNIGGYEFKAVPMEVENCFQNEK